MVYLLSDDTGYCVIDVKARHKWLEKLWIKSNVSSWLVFTYFELVAVMNNGKNQEDKTFFVDV